MAGRPPSRAASAVKLAQRAARKLGVSVMRESESNYLTPHLRRLFAVLAIVIEVGGSILLIVGWKTRWVAWLLALFVLIAALAAHRFWQFDAAQYANQMNHFMKNLAIIGGLLFVATFGPGSASVDKS